MLLLICIIIYGLCIFNLVQQDDTSFTYRNIDLKKRNVYTAVLLLLLIILMGGTTNNPDYLNYKDIYLNNLSGLEIGYVGLMSLSKKIGLSYEFFHLFLTVLGFGLIYLGLIKYKVNKLAFLAVYFLYPFLLDSIQIRNFLMMALIFLALAIFISEPDIKKKYGYYYILVVAGVLIQKLALVYLLFPVFLIVTQSKKNLKIYFRILIILSLISLFPNIYISFLEGLFNTFNIDNEKILYYLIERKVRYGFIVFWLITLLVLLATRIMDFLPKNNKLERLNIQILTSFVYFSTLFTPLYTIDLSFWRLMRNAIPIFLLLFLKIVIADDKNIKEKKNKKIIYLLTFFVWVLLLVFENRLLLKSTFFPMLFENWII